MMDATAFDLDAGALCLDFANTAEWHASSRPVDKLNDISDLVDWGEAAGILAPKQAQALRGRAGSEVETARSSLARAIQLREAVYRLFAGYAERGAIGDEDLATLNEELADARSQQRIAPDGQGFGWVWLPGPPAFDQVGWAVVLSAAELLTSERLDRVRQCADDRGCGYLFVDTSRNRSRRWCSMASCGNRAKARRHYERKK